MGPLKQLPFLKTLNISNNELQTLNGIQECPELNTLLCAGNKLDDIQSISAVGGLPELETLDLQDNKIEDVEVVSKSNNALTQLSDAWNAVLIFFKGRKASSVRATCEHHQKYILTLTAVRLIPP